MRAEPWPKVKATADLRDRIAAAIRRVDESYLNRPEPFMAEPASYEELADAVIAELGLRPEWGSLDEDFGGFLHDDRAEVTTGPKEKIYLRYITGWVAE